MDSKLPICIIFLDSNNEITGYNDFFKKELEVYSINNYIFNGNVTNYINEFSIDMSRQKRIITIGNTLINCIASCYNSCLFIEPVAYNKSFMRFIGHELKTFISASLDILGFLTKSSSPEQKKFIEPLKKNNLLMLKTMNNTIEYLKLTSGLIIPDIEDFSIIKAVEEVKKIIEQYNIHVNFINKRDVIISTDYKKFIEMVVHIISNSSRQSEQSPVTVKSSLVKDIFTMYFTDTGEKLTKYQKETIFEGFFHSINKTDNSSLYMPIAKGLAILLGGNLEIDSSTDNGTTYKFSIKTKYTDSDSD
jgi:signal transduction histidine kinase